jgi:hypothetical protein
VAIFHSKVRTVASISLDFRDLWRCYRRKMIGSYASGFSFKEIFGNRVYQSMKVPALLLYYLHHQSNINVSQIALSFPCNFDFDFASALNVDFSSKERT